MPKRYYEDQTRRALGKVGKKMRLLRVRENKLKTEARICDGQIKALRRQVHMPKGPG